MITKGIILSWIQHLQQSRGRISLVITAHLVHLIQEENRIAGTGFLKSFQDAARNVYRVLRVRGHARDPAAYCLRDLADVDGIEDYRLAPLGRDPGNLGDVLRAPPGLLRAEQPRPSSTRLMARHTGMMKEPTSVL